MDPNQSIPNLEPNHQAKVNHKKSIPRNNQAKANKEKIPMTPKSITQSRLFPTKPPEEAIDPKSNGHLTFPMQNHFNPTKPNINDPMHINDLTPMYFSPMHSNSPSLVLILTAVNPDKHSAITLVS